MSNSFPGINTVPYSDPINYIQNIAVSTIYCVTPTAFCEPKAEQFDFKFKGIAYRAMRPSMLSILQDPYITFSNPISTFSEFSYLNSVSPQERASKALKALEKALIECYSLGVEYKEIQKIWDFELVKETHVK